MSRLTQEARAWCHAIISFKQMTKRVRPPRTSIGSIHRRHIGARHCGIGGRSCLHRLLLGLGDAYVLDSNMVFCAVYGCNERSGRPKKGVLSEKVSFFRLPCVRQIGGPIDNEVSRRRRKAWLNRLQRSDIDENATHYRVCAKHFITGGWSLIWRLSRSINALKLLLCVLINAVSSISGAVSALQNDRV